jgi:antidote-toxin recognition MazE-like antitoxin
MASATLTSKGQVTLPKSVRDRLGFEAGDPRRCEASKADFSDAPIGECAVTVGVSAVMLPNS